MTRSLYMYHRMLTYASCNHCPIYILHSLLQLAPANAVSWPWTCCAARRVDGLTFKRSAPAEGSGTDWPHRGAPAAATCTNVFITSEGPRREWSGREAGLERQSVSQ